MIREVTVDTNSRIKSAIFIVGIIWLLPFYYLIFKHLIKKKEVVYLVILNCISDTLQYLFGLQFGQSDILSYLFGEKIKKYKKPFPTISPNKTLIGYLGGMISAFIISIYIVPFTKPEIVSVLITGVLGDLFASKIKRVLNIKDFSKLLGSHGGLLDRLDSLILSSITYYGIKTYSK